MNNTPKEWALIEKISYRVQRQNDHIVVPLGDDAFVFKNFPGYSVICQDMMVEGTHFSSDYFSAFDLGYKALAINLSDIAAMGARPHFVHVSIALPKNINESWLDDFYFGMSQLADDNACQIVGGDLSRTVDKIVIDVNVHGSCEFPFTRRGTQAGDLLLCSGPLGLAHTGLLALQRKDVGYETAKKKHLRPTPRLDLVKSLIAQRSKIHALMDCSDGLINDTLQLQPKNGGFHIFTDSLPLHADTTRAALTLGIPAEEFAFWGGEDFELLMTISPDDYDLFPNWHLIGQFTESPGVFSSTLNQKIEIKEFKGWQHFS